jgi:mannose-6-phosphate isomerase
MKYRREYDRLELYPLATEPVYRHYLGGGQRLHALLGKPLGERGTLAESWEVADEARVANGPLAGQTLRAVDEASDGALVGDGPHYPQARIPLLIKLSNAEDDLSVQVHPDDAYALAHSSHLGYPGKTEMYYIIAADPGAGIYFNLRPGVTLDQFRQTLEAGESVRELLNFVPVQAGDVLYSPSRLIHAIGKGLVYCEIQQNSDITYRLYDWGRVGPDGQPRPLHIADGLAVADLLPDVQAKITPLVLEESAEGRWTMLAAGPYFAVELIEGEAAVPLARARRAVQTVTVLDGTLTLTHAGAETATVRQGQSAVIPAALQDVQAVPDGPARFLFAYLPDFQADVIAPLQAQGATPAQIAALGGNLHEGPLVAALGGAAALASPPETEEPR